LLKENKFSPKADLENREENKNRRPPGTEEAKERERERERERECGDGEDA
jgi:hypothetical protein